MKHSLSTQEWIKEFEEFLGVQPQLPPEHLSQSILSYVHSDLNPSPWKVFSKLSLIHALVGGITLLFCPQFGLSLWDGMGMMHIFMKWGEQVCMLACGAVFMAGSLLVASLGLRVEEIRVIRKTELLQISILGLLSLGAFLCLGLNIVLSLAAFWFLGSLFGGIITLELGWKLRLWLQSRANT